MRKNFPQCREILGVSPTASPEEIRQVYHDLVKVWHPDRFAHDARLQQHAQEKLKEINEAYDFLTSSGSYTTGRPASSAKGYQPPAPAGPPPKDKYRMMPLVSFLTLLIAIVLLSLIFFFYGVPYEPVHSNKELHEVT